ncbi:MFS general substrate transporter [Mycena galericulata]|nr:MFS general substrate transporter [Mycena galericulata]
MDSLNPLSLELPCLAGDTKSDPKLSLEKASDSQLGEKSSGSSEHLDFGGESTLPPPPTLTTEEERKLWRKIDLRLMPILSLMYLLSFLDRGNIGNARLQGLDTQLNLTGNKFNIALTMYFIPYCIFEFPAKSAIPISVKNKADSGLSMVLKRFRPSRWLPGLTVVWGIIMTLMGLVKTYPQLVGVRICLGVAEAGLFPGLVYYLTLWYPRHMLQWRICLFFGAASLAGAFGGALAYGISFMGGTRGLLGWSWIFILEGIATVIVGIAAFFVVVRLPGLGNVPDPGTTGLCCLEEDTTTQSVGEEEHFEMRHLVEAMTDWQVWLHMLIYMSYDYEPLKVRRTIITTFGHSAAVSQLLTVPPYVLARFLLNLIGFSINISNAPSGIMFPTSSVQCFHEIERLGNNLSGQYKRGIGMALQIGTGHFGGAFASNMYRTQDKPRFLVGRIGLISTVVAALVSNRVNHLRDEATRASGREGRKQNVQ